jgi:UDP-N-acetylmuramoylalanine--D-glutamate ligase
VSPGVPHSSPVLREVVRRHLPLIGELELGYRHTRCPSLAITGTNGKTTTTELVERLLRQAGRRTVAAGNIGLPSCQVASQTGELDFLTLEISSFQLETVQFFHPVAAVLLNLTPDHFDRYSGMEDYIRAKARVFMNQGPEDWAILQVEAWEQMAALHLEVAARRLTFSVRAPQADLYWKPGWICCRHPDYAGRLLDLSTVRLHGPHNLENLMAALAVGLALGLDMEAVRSALRGYLPAPHRCEWVAAIEGVDFINDSKATNVDAVKQALLSVKPGPTGGPNIWLVAGGKDKGFSYDELGPILASRVKGAFLIGETRERIKMSWSRFTPCTGVDSLLEAVTRAAQSATRGEVVLLSPACSSFDMFQNYQDRGNQFRQAVRAWARQRGVTLPPEAKEIKKGKAA